MLNWRKIVFFTLFILLILAVAGCANQQAKSWEEIDQEQLLSELEREDVAIVDLREPSLYNKAHIPGAINIPFTDFQGKYQQLSKDNRIIFVCHMGPMGEASSQFLTGKGYTDLANLKGGMAEWTGPVTPGTP